MWIEASNALNFSAQALPRLVNDPVKGRHVAGFCDMNFVVTLIVGESLIVRAANLFYMILDEGRPFLAPCVTSYSLQRQNSIKYFFYFFSQQ